MTYNKNLTKCIAMIGRKFSTLKSGQVYVKELIKTKSGLSKVNTYCICRHLALVEFLGQFFSVLLPL